MENKYYTPDLTEFCPGFEYEEWVESYPEGFWTSTYVYGEASHSTPSLQSLRNLIKTENIRTKFLDQSDIESFGFKFTNKSIDLWFEIDGWWDISGGHRVKKYILHYGLYDNRMIIEGLTNGGDTDTFFEGTVKNKSQLRQLLKMLNIIE